MHQAVLLSSHVGRTLGHGYVNKQMRDIIRSLRLYIRPPPTNQPPIDPIAFFNLCLNTSSLIDSPPTLGISDTLFPSSLAGVSTPPSIAGVEITGVAATVASDFSGTGVTGDTVSEGNFWTISVQTALRCHLRLRVNYKVSL